MTELEMAHERYLTALDDLRSAKEELKAAAADYTRLAKAAGVKLAGDAVHEEFMAEARSLFNTPGASLYREMETWGEAPPLECGGVPA